MSLCFRSHQLKLAQTGSPGRFPVAPGRWKPQCSGEPLSPAHPGAEKSFPHSPLPLVADCGS